MMLKNKKSETTALEALVRTIATAAIIFLIVIPAGVKLYAYYSNPETKYMQSFQNFVDKINKMNLGRDQFTLNLNEKSAIIGFSKNADRYECFNCYIGVQNRPSILFNKPKDNECNNNACICLCNGGFQLIERDLDGKSTEFGQCTNTLQCKRIEQKNIVDKVIIKTYPGLDIKITKLGGGAEYWKNGFLYANGVPGSNGLKLPNQEINDFVVEKNADMIGICNYDMLKFNRDELHTDSCIITESSAK